MQKDHTSFQKYLIIEFMCHEKFLTQQKIINSNACGYDAFTQST